MVVRFRTESWQLMCQLFEDKNSDALEEAEGFLET
jgi:ribulose bisphosphate carboxylase small subunit